MNISAAICTYNRYDCLGNAIESLANQSFYEDEYEILVVDNSPDADQAITFGEKFQHIPNLRYVHEPTPGLSNARNVASALCRAPYIAYMDDDAEADYRWLAEIVSAFKSDINPRIVGGRAEPLWMCERPDWLNDQLLGMLSMVDWGGDEVREPADNEWFVGTNVSFHVETLNTFGGFSTQLGRKGDGANLLSNEESELVDAIKAKYPVAYAPHAIVSHRVEEFRLQQEWFRKRATWQAISDRLMNNGETGEYEQHMDVVRKFLNSREPRDRTVRGLFMPIDDDGGFRWQLSAIYALSFMLMDGLRETETD